MSVRREPDLEVALRSALRSLAPEPRPSLKARALAAVDGTPQVSPRSWAAWRAVWASAAVSIVVIAGIAAGIFIGNSPMPPSATSPSPSEGVPSSEVDATPSVAPPSGDVAQPPVLPGTWERLDLPDPAPGVFSSARASDVVAFHGGYVAVGSFAASCVSDIHEPPPGCEAALEALPTAEAAVVWLSHDARTWELLPFQGALDGASMEHAATDGSRIVVSGFLREPSARVPIVWVSDNGVRWEAVTQGDGLPEHLVWTESGFIGARATDDGPQFVASEDGRSWRPLTNPGDHGAGEVMGMSVGLDGTTVVAVGMTYQYADDGQLLTITGTSWLSREGTTWERAPANEGPEGAWMSAAAETDRGWVAVGLDQTVDVEPADEMAVWTSSDGLRWTRAPTSLIGSASDGYADEVVWTGEQLVATGSVGGEGGSVIAFWLSRDGTTWDAVEGQAALDEGTPDRLVAFDGWALAVGVRFTASDHMVGVVWIASP